MLKQNIYQHSISSSSSAQPEQQESTRYDVFELANENQPQTSVLLKLTDECSAAIRNAVNSKCQIRMHIKNGVATIEIRDRDGDVSTSSVHSKISRRQTRYAMILNRMSTGMLERLQRLRFRFLTLNVQATDKTFAEMKEKTQRLVEAEQQRKAKDISKIQRPSAASKKPILNQSSNSLVKKNVPATTFGHSNTNNILAKLSALKRTHSPSPLNVAAAKVKRVENHWKGRLHWLQKKLRISNKKS
uniref:Uncharacterized protein n=1 Tax=Meloidogyne enterolobii TaxID=390850 RepID=A0A6V7XBJ3_MELEN|nr:unnamed protein product [Meloidogyne enterolobii]